jgi:hypothetical protein
VHGLFFPVLGWKMNTPAGFRDVCAVAAFWVNSSDIFAAVAIKYVFVSVCVCCGYKSAAALKSYVATHHADIGLSKYYNTQYQSKGEAKIAAAYRIFRVKSCKIAHVCRLLSKSHKIVKQKWFNFMMKLIAQTHTKHQSAEMLVRKSNF